MYQFKIKEQENGSYRFELGKINIIIDGFAEEGGNHQILNPVKAIAFFNIEDNIYGISNDPLCLSTVEAFYDTIYQQYLIFTRKKLTAA